MTYTKIICCKNLHGSKYSAAGWCTVFRSFTMTRENPIERIEKVGLQSTSANLRTSMLEHYSEMSALYEAMNAKLDAVLAKLSGSSLSSDVGSITHTTPAPTYIHTTLALRTITPIILDKLGQPPEIPAPPRLQPTIVDLDLPAPVSLPLPSVCAQPATPLLQNASHY